MREFDGISAVVTGGASGLGAAVARGMLERGAQAAVLDRDVSGTPEGALPVVGDLADDASVVAAIARVVTEFGGLDVVVNSAGAAAQGDVAANDDAEWMRVWDVSVIGLARVIRAALPHLRASEHAAIVSISSVVAHVGMPDRALYSAIKGAVSALTRAMAADHLRDGIRVNAVSPGTVDTPWLDRIFGSTEAKEAARADLEARQPHGRLVTPDEIADAVLYLASPRSGSTTGIDLVVDGGIASIKPAVR